MIKPDISVIMPVLNAEEYISEAINSILNQTFENFEFIVIDDGSSDSSVEIIRNFHDPRIRLFENSSGGISQQLNYGIDNAGAEIIARMDADDISLPERFEIQYDYLTKNKSVDLVGTNIALINKNGVRVGNKYFPQNNIDIEFMMPILSSVCHASILTYKTVINKAGLYCKEHLYAEDLDLFLRMFSAGVKMHNIQKILYSYRIYNDDNDLTKSIIQDNSSYILGSGYLIKSNPDVNSFEYLYRTGLLEYYRGNISLAKKKLWAALKICPKKIITVFRYLLVSLLGDKIVKKMRKIGIPQKFSFLISKYLKLDLNTIWK